MALRLACESYSHSATASLSAPAAVTPFPQSHTPDVAAPQKGTAFEDFTKHIDT